MSKDAKQEGEIIDLTAKTTVYATEAAVHFKPGQEINTHPKQAEAMIKKGFATTEKPKKAKD